MGYHTSQSCYSHNKAKVHYVIDFYIQQLRLSRHSTGRRPDGPVGGLHHAPWASVAWDRTRPLYPPITIKLPPTTASTDTIQLLPDPPDSSCCRARDRSTVSSTAACTPVAWAMRTTAAKASPPLLLLLLLLPRPPLLLLPLPRLLLLLRMLSAHACKARRGQSHVNVPPSPPTKAPADHCEVWKVAMHAGGGHAGSMKKIGKHRTVRVAYRWRCRCPRAQLHIHVHGGADHMIRRRCRRR